MGDRTDSSGFVEDDILLSKLPLFLDEKEATNELYKNGQFQDASAKYIQILASILNLSGKNVNISDIKSIITSISSIIRSKELKQLLSTLLCNLALCYYNLKKIHETQISCEASLLLDDSNYKATYHIAYCYFLRNDYNTSLVYVQRCQQIATNNFKAYKNKRQPHLDLVEHIRKSIHREESKSSDRDCNSILENILNGINVNLNLQRLNSVPLNDIIKENVVSRLVELLNNKIVDRSIDDMLIGIWSCIFQILSRKNAKNNSTLTDQFIKCSKSLPGNIKELFKLEGVSSTVTSVMINISKCCAIVKHEDCLESLYTILCRDDSKLEDHVLDSILLFFSDIDAANITNPSRFNVILANVVEKLISIYDARDVSTFKQIDVCLIAIFRMKLHTCDVDDMFINMINSNLRKYVSLFEQKIEFKIPWYFVMKSLYLSNQTLFRGYLVTNNLIAPLVNSFFNFYSSEVDMQVINEYSSQIIIGALDFVDFRQRIIDCIIDDTTFIERLINVDTIKYINEVNAVQANDISESKSYKRLMLQEYKVLMLCKLTLHSNEVKEEIIKSINLFKLLQSAICFNASIGYPVEILMEALSYLTMHEEFKLTGNFSFIAVLLKLIDDKTECDHKHLLMLSHIIVNLMRSNADRYKFVNDNPEMSKYDSGQLEMLQKFQEKIPEVAKTITNGSYYEGSVKSAMKSRKAIFLLSDSIVVKALINSLKKIKRLDSDKEGIVYTNIMEILHYITCDEDNRTLLLNFGVLRIFIQAATSDIFRNTSKFKHIAQSIAHLCIATNPSNLNYSDALDSVQPLLTLMNDEHQLLQYEAALGLVNLLSINDDIKRRVFHLNGWKVFGELLYSDNIALRVSGLEGWCNLSAGEDVVHGYFYAQIIKQVEAYNNEDELFKLNINDINIMFAYTLDFENSAAVLASTGSIALLVRDLRIAQYVVFVPSFGNIVRVLDAVSDIPILHRVLTIISCVTQAKLKNAGKINTDHINYVKSSIKTATKRNKHKYVNETLINLANEI